MAEMEDKLVQYIQEAVAFEENVEQMLGSMISTTEDPEMKTRLEHHLEETKGQQERLRARLDDHGASGSTVKELGGKMGAMLKGLADMPRGDKAGRNARDGYATEHMEIAGYRLLEQVAMVAGDTKTAEVARQNCEEEIAMARFIDERWAKVAQASLAEEGVLA